MNSTNCEDTELTLGSDVVKTVLFIVHNCDFFCVCWAGHNVILKTLMPFLQSLYEMSANASCSCLKVLNLSV